MEINNFKDRLIRKDIKKIKRNYIDNIFSTQLNSNMIKIIMKYLDIKYLYEFAKSSIYIFNAFIDYENFELYTSLQKAEKKNLCKIITERDNEGFGYFIKISDNLKVLFNNRSINHENTKKIKVVKENKEKEIDLNNRIIFTDIYYGISIIEILEEKDDMHDFFDYDDNSNLNNNEPLCIFNTNTKADESIIYGLLNSSEKDENIFYYLSQNNNNEDFVNRYSPILNLSNNKLIGFHFEYNENDNNNNKGISLKVFIDLFIRENLIYKNETKFIHKGAVKKILRELDNFKKNKNNNYEIIPREDISIWDAIIIGPEDSPYHNGKFKLEINFVKDYPFQPPKIKFLTKIYHPNFRGDGKEVCRCALKELGTEWWPSITIQKILDLIYSLLKNPVPKEEVKCSNSNNECALLMIKDPEKYKEIALEWTKKFAI